jgi:tetratricopeptide (TPR) repeat protein
MTQNTTITPFWNRIPKFFLYGLYPYPLILTACIMFAAFFFGGPLFNFILYVVAIKYSAVVLQHTVYGELLPPKPTLEVINENYQLPFKLFFVFAIFDYGVGHFASSFNEFFFYTITFISSLLPPAIIISLMITEEIGYALNPFNWFKIAFRIGWPYLIMVVFLFLFSSVQSQFSQLVISHLPDKLIWPLWMAISTYFMLVGFHLIGYVVLQYHEELDIESPDVLQDAEGATSYNNNQISSPLLERFVAEGNVPAAVAEMASLMEEHPQDMELRRRIYVYLKSNGQLDNLSRYAPHYFDLLCSQNRFSDAAAVYLDSFELGQPFTPESSTNYLPVIQELRRRRAKKQAVQFAQGFHKRFPNDTETPAVYLEMAKILSEELQRDDLAKQTLQYLLKSFPEHALQPQVKQYMGILEQLPNTSPTN